jgi:hypothetical protein
VVHPQWRGLGLAVRLVRQALATMTTPYTEALAAMGRVHPFFERAGMSPTLLPPDAVSRRLVSAAELAGLSQADLAAVEPVRRLLEGGAGGAAGRGSSAGRQKAIAQFRHVLDRCIARAFNPDRLRRIEDPLAEICRRTARQYVYYLWQGEE